MIYFNDNEPYVAEWLKNLYPKADVDSRSVTDIEPQELTGYMRAHFFAGIGGWEYALQLAGWPDDLPVWTASLPCQPFSTAGKRKGEEDERHLWPVFRQLVAEQRPPVIFGEQVASKDGKVWLSRVRADLEALGYGVGAADLCAAGIGAPHIRQRLYWVAYSQRDTSGQGRLADEPGESTGETTEGAHAEPGRRGDSSRLGNPDDERSQGRLIRRNGTSECFTREDGLGPWSRFDLIECADGKVRRIPTEPELFPLAHGPESQYDTLGSIESEAWEEVVQYANESQRDPSEVLSIVRNYIYSVTSGKESDARMLQQLYAPKILFPFLLRLDAAQESQKSGSVTEDGKQVAGQYLQLLREFRGTGDASRGWEPSEQLGNQSPDPLLRLSFILARHAKAYRTTALAANAAINRVSLLRAAGNAVVPPLAAIFIQSVMDVMHIESM